jgi:ubiquinone biosynthesis protein
MDRVDGERLTDFLDRCHRDAEQHGRRDAVLAALVRTYAAQILGAGRFQADPHPGNFLVRPDGRLALLDFGAMRDLSNGERRAYAALTGAVIARDGTRAARLMTELGFSVRPGGDPAALLQFADLLLDAFRPAPDRPLASLDPREAFDQTLALGRESPIIIPHHFVQIGRVLASLAGLVLAYRPRIELWPLVAPFLVVA